MSAAHHASDEFNGPSHTSANGFFEPMDSTHDTEINGIPVINKIARDDYDAHHHRTPFLIGVAGGTASGKTSVCRKIVEKLGQDCAEPDQQRVVIINQDAFYRRLNEKEHKAAEIGLFNFDHPDAFDDDLLYRTMMDILAGKTVQIPTYDYVTHTRRDDEARTVYPADVVLVEGILVFYFPAIRNLFHMKLFVDTDADIRLSRRVLRDIKERGRDLSGVIQQYITTVKPAFEDFCLPTKKYADVIIPRGADNEVALALLLQYIKQILGRMRSNRSRLDSENMTQESICSSLESDSFLRRNTSLSRICSVIHPQVNHS